MPQSWQLCAVNGNKKPYHPDGISWLNPLDRKKLWKEIHEEKCLAVGILSGKISGGIVAIDHDGESCDFLIEQISGGPVADALPRTIGFTSGKAGRYQLLYQIHESFWLSIRSKIILTGVQDSNSKDEQLDFRWDGRQSVIVGKHPETGTYKWLPGQSPTEVEVAECPFWIIRQMLCFQQLLPNNRKDWSDRDWALEYLGFIQNNNLEWHQWRNILLALHYAGVEKEIAWIWSATSDKHTAQGFDDVWQHINDNCANPIGLGTLCELAKQGGWKGKGQQPHSQEFKDIDEVQETATELAELIKLDTIIHPSVLPQQLLLPLGNLANRLGVPVEVYSCVLLPILASQVRTGTRIELDPSTNFFSPPIFWMGIVGESGSKKSPIIRGMMAPLDLFQEASEEEYLLKLEEYELDLQNRKAKPESEHGKRPKPPIPREHYVSDFTLEALTEVIHTQKEDGLLVYVDELPRFFTSMDSYRNGKEGTDNIG